MVSLPKFCNGTLSVIIRRVRVSACFRTSERVCVCVRERENERVRVCACFRTSERVCVCERERENESARVCARAVE